MQVLHESNLTTELIKGPITYEICRRTRTPLPLFTVTLLKHVSSAPSIQYAASVRVSVRPGRYLFYSGLTGDKGVTNVTTCVQGTFCDQL